MTAPAGGLRDRLILTALYDTVYEILDTLGWFTPGRQHEPINMVGKAVDVHTSIPKNTLTVSAESVDGTDAELGSLAEEVTRPYWIDFFAQDDAVGAALIGDVREGLKGKLAGRTGPVLDVWDDTLATPALSFQCTLENIVSDRAHEFTDANRKHWYSISLDVIDDVD